MTRLTATLLLLMATTIWGFAFVAQKTAMDSMGPLTFIGARYLLGGLAIVPLALREYRRVGTGLTRRQWAILGFLSVNFFLGSWLQQLGLMTTTVTNGGFLTGLYVFFVPLIQLVLYRTRPHAVTWLCVPIAIGGLYLLNGGKLDAMGTGDTLVISSAVFWALQVLVIGYLARETRMPVFISSLCFIAAGLIASTGAFATEPVTLDALGNGWIEIAYAGLMSTSIAFTLQAVGQIYVPPANAAIILSSETLFAAIGGALLLGERLLPIGYAGAFLIFLAIVLVETVPALGRRRTAAAAAET